jgi:hypothetical protein
MLILLVQVLPNLIKQKMKNKEKNLAILGASLFLAIAAAIGSMIRKL